MNPIAHPTPQNPDARRRGIRRLVDRTPSVAALVALATWGSVTLVGMSGASDQVQRAGTRTAGRVGATVLQEIQPSDLTLWSPGRITAWRASLTQPAPPPIAILRIPKIQLEVAVLPGTGDFVLNRGVGHIEGTPLPGANGNSGIAGHRDGFFRGLKDIAVGDAIEMETADGRQMYRVERTWIVKPEDVSVLDPTSTTALTFVTCYPFYFIGEAPQRFIVRATRQTIRSSE